jgi:hypothetical protein
MANQKIRSSPDWDIRGTGGTEGWQQGSQPNQSDMGKTREPRASPDSPDPHTVTQGGSR